MQMRLEVTSPTRRYDNTLQYMTVVFARVHAVSTSCVILCVEVWECATATISLSFFSWSIRYERRTPFDFWTAPFRIVAAITNVIVFFSVFYQGYSVMKPSKLLLPYRKFPTRWLLARIIDRKCNDDVGFWAKAVKFWENNRRKYRKLRGFLLYLSRARLVERIRAFWDTHTIIRVIRACRYNKYLPIRVISNLTKKEDT